MAETETRIARLPKWAQDHICRLERQRERAVAEMNAALDTQSESPMYVDALVLAGETGKGPTVKRRYVQGRQIVIEWQDVRLSVDCRGDGLRLQWETSNRGVSRVAMIPDSFQAAYLVTRENMR